MPSDAVLKKCVGWLNDHFRSNVEKTFEGTPFELAQLYAIAWKESSELWPNLIDTKTPAEILGLCVLDGSGDVPNKPRSAYPQKKAVLQKDDPELTTLLMEEGNKARVARGMKPSSRILYKAYGIFQYDLQAVKTDREFFAGREWYQIDECLDRFKGELMEKYKITKDVRKAIRAYNGTGPDAEAYVKDVYKLVAQMEKLGLP